MSLQGLVFALLGLCAALVAVILALLLRRARSGARGTDRGVAAPAAPAAGALASRAQAAEERAEALAAEMTARTADLERKNQELSAALEQLRRAQDDVLRSEKLASIGRLVAGVAHEVNNPMNAVLNSLGPLEEAVGRAAASPDATASAAAREAQEMLAVVKRGASRTKGIVQALHNYSRGDMETLKDVNLLRALDDTLDLLRHRLRRIQVVRDIDARTRVTGFAGQIDQVLMNLLTNAVQAIGDAEGTITVGLHGGEREVVLTVADSGAGIPAEVLPRIFDPFFTTKDVGEGAGLGLSIVHGIVERHGGRIEVESAPSEGTTFRVHLPVHAGFVAAVKATPSTAG
jgi:signal transduction histidine kinase